ncbi:hypothetical protein [Streptomyces sp. NPDC013489]|uniref:hypothetical protein n=1 Tax=Streptomyces sp. NPDC013489 TaxID=3155606 RepID=UPI0033DEB33A
MSTPSPTPPPNPNVMPTPPVSGPPPQLSPVTPPAVSPSFVPQAPLQVISAPPAHPAPPLFGIRDGNAVDEFADVFDDGVR